MCHCLMLVFCAVVIDVDFPELFEEFLQMMTFLKGNIIQFLNIKCAVHLDLYSEFVFAMGAVCHWEGHIHVYWLDIG